MMVPASNVEEKTILRARDFWASLTLIAAAMFFLWSTSFIPLFGQNSAGVAGGGWYNSAALVPFGIFTALLLMAISLLTTSIREGGAQYAFSSIGLGWDPHEAWRIGTIAVILFFYIVGLVPRVDFIIGSALLITGLIYGYHSGQRDRMGVAAVAMMFAGSYALIFHFPQSEWSKPHDDDIMALITWGVLVFLTLMQAKGSKVMLAIPFISALVPFIFVCAMAFGFKQNIPNRGGLVFSTIEYHYYVTLKPLWGK